MDKTNAADLSSHEFTILISITRTKNSLKTKFKIHSNTKVIAITQTLSTTGIQECHKGIAEMYCLFIVADSIVHAISFNRHIVL